VSDLQYFETWQLHVEHKRRNELEGWSLVNVAEKKGNGGL
jgi:hypothetical protein